MNLNQNTACTVNAGFASADISPWDGVHLGGGDIGVYRPTNFVRRRLYAKASVFKAEKTVCVIELDVLIINEIYCDRIRNAVSEKLGIPYEAVMVFSIQSHSAPFIGDIMFDYEFPIKFSKEDEYVTGINSDYSDFVCEQAIKAAQDAFADVRKLKMDVKSGFKHGLAFCRRIILRDNTLVMFSRNSVKNQPLGPEISHLESSMDDEVGVVCFKDGTELVSGMLHFTSHPVNDFCTPSLKYCASPDWCGVWAEELQKKLNIRSIPSVLNGCCGNVNPHDPFTPDFVPDAERMGGELTNLAEKITLAMTFENADTPAVVDYTYTEVPMDYREIPAEWQAKVIDTVEHGEIKRKPNGDFDAEWTTAASVYSTLIAKKREPKFKYPVQVFRVGGLAIVAFPGEPFTDTQLEIKLASKAPMTYVTHCANKYVGYMPPERAYAYDGHETNSKCTYWAKLAPGSIEKARDAALCGIEKLFS